MKLAFIGLGAMGRHMAANLQRQATRCAPTTCAASKASP